MLKYWNFLQDGNFGGQSANDIVDKAAVRRAFQTVSNNHKEEPTDTRSASRKTSPSTRFQFQPPVAQLHFHARLLNSPGISYKGKGSGCCSSMEFPFYHGNITRKTCEELLSKKGKDGSFLLRESESVAGALCLCVFFEQLIYTYRIFRESEGYLRIQYFLTGTSLSVDADISIYLISLRKPSTSEDVPKRVFKTIKDLIYAYEKPNQGLVVNLRYPVRRPKPPRRKIRKSKVEVDEDYDEVEDRDYVDVLP